jgi:anti-sigma B factor antagonist
MSDPNPKSSVVIELGSAGSDLVVSVRGELDMTLAPDLYRSLASVASDDYTGVVIDLSAVEFVDSSGLGVLVNAHRRAQSSGSNLQMRLPEGSARFPFEVTGLDAVFGSQWETSSEAQSI